MSIWYPGYGTSFSKYLLLETKVGRDLAGPITKSGESITSYISEQTRSIVANNDQLEQILGSGFNSLTNSINWGFDSIEFALQDVNASIESLHASFNYGLTLMLDQVRISNNLLTSLIEKIDSINDKLGNPTLTGSREFYNMGCVRLSKGLYDKALESFHKAEKMNDTDFFTQFKIGNIYLYGINNDVNVIDLDKAKYHLLNAARYAKAECIIDASFEKLGAEAYLHAAISIYAKLHDLLPEKQQKEYQSLLDEAIQLTKKAAELNPNLAEAYYHEAKFYALQNQAELSISLLKKAIDIDMNYAIKVSIDKAFDNVESNVQKLLYDLKEINKKDCINLLPNVQSLVSNLKKWTFNNSSYNKEFFTCLQNYKFVKQNSNYDTILGYYNSIPICKKIIETIPELINNRKTELRNELKIRIHNCEKMLSDMGRYGYEADENIENTLFFINSAKTGLTEFKNQNDYENALSDISKAQIFSEKAKQITDNFIRLDKEQRDQKNRQEKEEKEKILKEKKLQKTRNESSLDRAGGLAFLGAIIGFITGFVSCVKNVQHDGSGNWHFITYAFWGAIIGAIVGAISGQLKSE